MTTRTTITLPEDLMDFAYDRATDLATADGSDINLSRYIRLLVIEDKKEFEEEIKRRTEKAVGGKGKR